MRKMFITTLTACVMSFANPAHATWDGPPEKRAEHARYTCEVMMRDLDDALEKGLSLNNTGYSSVNWVMTCLGPVTAAPSLLH
jgi:hypothetical protein